MTAIIIEDETAAVNALKDVLCHNSVARIEVVAELDSIAGSVEWLRSSPAPDIIFMDIHLADGSAFKIFEQVDVEVPVVFTTAYDEYALEAFRVSSIDYLLKPVTLDSLEHALKKFMLFNPTERREHARRTNTAIKNRDNMPIFFREGNRIVRLHPDEILYLEGYGGDYVKVHRKDGKPLLSQINLKSFENILDEYGFCRVHRSYIVSLPHIDYIERKRIRIDGALIPISDSYSSALMDKLGVRA